MYRLSTLSACLIAVTAAACAQPGIWSDDINVSSNSGSSKSQDLVVDHANNFHLVWEDNTAWSGPQTDILYSCFDGQTWSPHELVSFPYANYSLTPRLAVDSYNRPHVVWEGNAYANPITYYSLRDSAGIWSEPLNLSAGASYNCKQDIAIDSQDNVHVIWNGIFAGLGRILYRYFDGNQWSSIENLTPDFESGYSRFVVDSQDRLHLVFRGHVAPPDVEIMYMCKDSAGWSEPIILSNNLNQIREPDVAADENDNPHVLWNQSFGPYLEDIFYCRFDGQTWLQPENISNSPTAKSFPSIAISSDMTFVGYTQTPSSGYAQIMYTYCCDSLWSVPDTLHQIPENHVAWTAPVFDLDGHLQMVSTPYLAPFNTELFHQTYVNSPDLLPVELTPHSPPITIPPPGGSFSFDVRFENHAVLPVSFDAWIEAVLPSGSTYGPILQRSLTLPASGLLFRPNLTQFVPPGAPAGEYRYRLRVGDYSDSVVVSADSFSFVKEGVSASMSGDWLFSGWDDAAPSPETYDDGFDTHPSSFSFSITPNPCNPTTTIRFDLPQAGWVKLEVFDVQGRSVGAQHAAPLSGSRTTPTTETWLPAGAHHILFDGSDLPSGIYLARLTAGDWSAARKLVLLK